MKKIIIVMMVVMSSLSFSKTFGDWKTGVKDGRRYMKTTSKDIYNKETSFEIQMTPLDGFDIIVYSNSRLGIDDDYRMIFFSTGNEKNNIMMGGKTKDYMKVGKNGELKKGHVITLNVKKYTSRMDIYESILSKLKSNNKINIFTINSNGYNSGNEFSLKGFNNAYKHFINKKDGK